MVQVWIMSILLMTAVAGCAQTQSMCDTLLRQASGNLSMDTECSL